MFRNNPMLTDRMKVCLPSTEEDFEAGVGESLWVLVGPGAKEEWAAGTRGVGFIGVLDGRSIYYPSLGRGDLVVFEMKGVERAVVNWKFLADEAAREGYDPVANRQDFVDRLFLAAI